jgi:putative two-component system response regulator
MDRPNTVLIVDDDKRSVALLETILQGLGYKTASAADGRIALRLVAAELPDLVLLDIMMPNMDGFETVARLKGNPRTKAVPVIMLTALDDPKSKLRALESGAEEVLTKPIDRAELTARVRNLLRLKEYADFLARHNEILESQVKDRTAQLEEAYRDTLFTLTRAAEYKDEDTGLHVRRISHYCLELAVVLGLDADFCEAIFHASPMHDIGKIGIPDSVLLKRGPLDQDEWAIMKTHCQLGSRILAAGRSPYVWMGSEIALNHHERWDGSGYPRGLSGEAIPLAARIMQICDVYDALRSRRAYKPALAQSSTIDIITNGDGRTRPDHFDPTVLAAFVASTERFGAIYAEYADVH